MNDDLMKKYIETRNSISKNYNKSSEKSLYIVEGIVNDLLDNINNDSKNLIYPEFSKKYKIDSMLFEYTDFTQSEVKEIIAETPLTERDRKIAILRYLDLKSEEDIADKLSIDKKTVHNNLPKISYLLKCTCNKIYNK